MLFIIINGKEKTNTGSIPIDNVYNIILIKGFITRENIGVTINEWFKFIEIFTVLLPLKC